MIVYSLDHIQATRVVDESRDVMYASISCVQMIVGHLNGLRLRLRPVGRRTHMGPGSARADCAPPPARPDSITTCWRRLPLVLCAPHGFLHLRGRRTQSIKCLSGPLEWQSERIRGNWKMMRGCEPGYGHRGAMRGRFPCVLVDVC